MFSDVIMGDKVTRGSRKPSVKDSQGRKGSTTTVDDADSYPCGECKKPVKDNDKALQCELCERWLHAACCDVDDTYKAMKNNCSKPVPKFHFYCDLPCNKFATNFIGSMKKLEEQVEQKTKVVAEHTAKFKELEEGRLPPLLLETIKQMGGPTSADPNPEQNEQIAELVERKTKAQIAEMEDRNRRKTNLIIFRLPESGSPDSAGKKKDDTGSATKILKEIKSTHTPIDVSRLGIEKEGSSTPRPLRLAFANAAARDETLRIYHKARKTAEDKEPNCSALFTKLSIRKDMTPGEREEETALYKELQKKRNNASGEDKARWVRRGGRVIFLGKTPDPPGAHVST